MPTEFHAYDELNRRWKSTCRILLGGEVGGLDDFSDWLSEYKKESHAGKSYMSGKETVYGDLPYPKDARWISFEEIKFDKKYPKLNLNQIKDFDSLLDAVSERVEYAGNIILGNSNFAQSSTYVIDSFYVYRSEQVFESKYVAYTTHCIYSDSLFGCTCTSCNFAIRANNFMCSNNFEVSKIDYSSNIYFSHGLSGCNDCMFSFNLKNKRNCIGNLELPKEKYLQIKAKLLEEMRFDLAKNKRLPGLEKIISASKPNHDGVAQACLARRASAEKTDRASIDKAYSETGTIILGKSFGAIERNAGWLSRAAARYEEEKSCVSGEPVHISAGYAWFSKFPKNRLLKLFEADAAGEALKISPSEAETLGLKDASRTLSKIAYYCPEWQVGTNHNNIDCPTTMDSANCYKCEISINAKSCGHCFWPRNSEALFGCYATGISSSFCLKCYYSKNLSRCLEVDSGRNCADCFFCHNCENCTDCIFCFNVKNLRYAIGNVEYSREEYLKIKKMLLYELNAELEKTGKIRKSIFELLSKRA